MRQKEGLRDKQDRLRDKITRIKKATMELSKKCTCLDCEFEEYKNQQWEAEARKTLDEIDFELACLEDYTHGTDGKRITEMRKKITALQSHGNTTDEIIKGFIKRLDDCGRQDANKAKRIEQLTAQLNSAKSEAWDASTNWWLNFLKKTNLMVPHKIEPLAKELLSREDADKAAYIGTSNTLTEDKKEEI
jgi:Mg2+ and Co2+ transporter CorA